MATIGTFAHYTSQDGNYSGIGLVCQSLEGGLSDAPRHLILAERRIPKRMESSLLTTTPFSFQQKVLSYLKKNLATGDIKIFPKNQFIVDKPDNQMQPLGVLFFSHGFSTVVIDSLPQLEQILQDFLPMSEYQYGSIIRIFKSFQLDFDNTTPPKLSL